MKYISRARANIIEEASRMAYGDSVTLERNESIEQEFAGEVHFGVNWSCIGVQEPEEARAFGEQITKLSEIAEYINAYHLREIDRDYTIDCKDTYRRQKAFVADLFRSYHIEEIKLWLYGGMFNPVEYEELVAE